jgi:hypothetical protein
MASYYKAENATYRGDRGLIRIAVNAILNLQYTSILCPNLNNVINKVHNFYITNLFIFKYLILSASWGIFWEPVYITLEETHKVYVYLIRICLQHDLQMTPD